ncbi:MULTISPECIES: PHP domain-containing protein [unclassified Lentimicrobium]|uniref:PHP domain-containing protein n=1 Tax=unclassified Lentimicrobium TaxID=2677434 RepID=UPI001552230B|nr:MULTISPECIES: PHP domain-containing protein [unclassified Lentimicrobium]NPD46393.1 PHP domain-containing protein [Lentimicrobium sp. S6]NPD83579.1 PHP domain-containing protein [Lentimicrobium sp. L6]
MIKFRADLHLHTVLSPCGDLDMSPSQLVEHAHLRGIQIMGITDHNSTKHARLVRDLAAKVNIFTLCGAELTSKEEAHLLCFMPNDEKLQLLQDFIDENILKIPNNPKYFGEQLVVNEKEEIISEEEYLLINAIDKDVDEIGEFVMHNGGFFIPAHVDRPAFSLTSQLGFIPPDIKCTAIEISKRSSEEELLSQFPYLKGRSFIQSSDAHYVEDIASAFTNFYLKEANFEEMKKAFSKLDGRYCEIPK